MSLSYFFLSFHFEIGKFDIYDTRFNSIHYLCMLSCYCIHLFANSWILLCSRKIPKSARHERRNLCWTRWSSKFLLRLVDHWIFMRFVFKCIWINNKIYAKFSKFFLKHRLEMILFFSDWMVFYNGEILPVQVDEGWQQYYKPTEYTRTSDTSDTSKYCLIIIKCWTFQMLWKCCI